MSYDSIVQHLRDKYNEGVILSLENRKIQLQAFYKMINENQDAICDAMWKDLHKPKAECLTHETDFLLAEISDAISSLKSWTAPTKVTRYILQAADSAYIQKDPLGVVCIIGSWNFPTRLLLAPAIGAIAAGNTVVLKPCRVSFATATLFGELVPKYLSPDVVQVIQGGAAETTELLKQRFDHIFYTGNPNVGKLIMKAASEHLTPVTLELGGKNPVIIDKDVDLQTVARRIVWGKCANAGQICVTADYILNLNPKRDELVKHISEAIIEFYGQNQKESPDFGRIVNERHFDRLAALLESTKGEIAFGGDKDRQTKYIQPTVVVDVKTDDILLQDEIFGPILPIVNMETIEEAIQYIKSKEKPLALYVFSQNSSRVDKVVKNTSSGAVTVNDLIMHMSLETLPFGGVGNSGMGRYHGKFTFDTFTHEKSVLNRAAGLEKLLFMRYPPHDENKLTWARRFFAKLKVPF